MAAIAHIGAVAEGDLAGTVEMKPFPTIVVGVVSAATLDHGHNSVSTLYLFD